MDESAEVPKIQINEVGEIVDNKKTNPVTDWLKHKRGILRWAVRNVRAGNHRAPQPGEVGSNLEAIRAKVENSTPVKIDSSGKIIE